MVDIGMEDTSELREYEGDTEALPVSLAEALTDNVAEAEGVVDGEVNEDADARCEAERTAAGGAPAPPRRPARSSRGRSSSADDGGGAPAAKRRRRESAWLGAWRAAG